MMDIRKVKKLIEMLEESSLAEIEIREGEEAIRISRTSSSGTPVVHMTPAHVAPHHAAPAAAAPTTSTPEAKPFVDVGSQVTVGDPLCIIEAMKMKNDIDPGKARAVKAILKEDA